MRPEYQTGDIVVAVLAALGVVVLVVLFIVVFRSTFLNKD